MVIAIDIPDDAKDILMSGGREGGGGFMIHISKKAIDDYKARHRDDICKFADAAENDLNIRFLGANDD